MITRWSPLLADWCVLLAAAGVCCNWSGNAKSVKHWGYMSLKVYDIGVAGISSRIWFLSFRNIITWINSNLDMLLATILILSFSVFSLFHNGTGKSEVVLQNCCWTIFAPYPARSTNTPLVTYLLSIRYFNLFYDVNISGSFHSNQFHDLFFFPVKKD